MVCDEIVRESIFASNLCIFVVHFVGESNCSSAKAILFRDRYIFFRIPIYSRPLYWSALQIDFICQSEI